MSTVQSRWIAHLPRKLNPEARGPFPNPAIGDICYYAPWGDLVRRYLPYFMDLVLKREINPGRVFDLEIPLSDVAQGYRAMDARRAIQALLRL